jgi:hypothetical protein
MTFPVFWLWGVESRSWRLGFRLSFGAYVEVVRGGFQMAKYDPGVGVTGHCHSKWLRSSKSM